MNTSTGLTKDLARWLERIASRPVVPLAQGKTPQASPAMADPREAWIVRWQTLTRPFDARAPRERVLLGLGTRAARAGL